MRYSPDGRYIASASFDKSVRLWHGTTGKFIAVFRGHVQAVYQVGWRTIEHLSAVVHAISVALSFMFVIGAFTCISIPLLPLALLVGRQPLAREQQ